MRNSCPPRTRLTNIDEEITALLNDNNPDVYVANTLEEVSTKMGVAPVTLTATVADRNGYCVKGYDKQFAKDRIYLRPVKTPKFYAVRCFPEFFITCGGIKINEKMQVLDKGGAVIPGLYAVGTDAGGMNGDTYDVVASGIGSAFAINSSLIAAENALN